jgi:succinylglutamate desuccinylase
MAMQSLEWSKDLQRMFRQKEQHSTILNLTASEQKAVQQVSQKTSQTAKIDTVWE